MNLQSRLEQCYTGAVYDVLRSMEIKQCVLPHTLRPLDPTRRFAGKIFTVSGRPDPSISAHESLLQWTGLLSKSPPGSVIICQPNDSTMAHMGELSAETLQLKAVRGYIVDGGCRDADAILRLGFPVWCRYLTPIDVVGGWKPESFGETITLGGVEVRSGDWAFADRDGVVLIPDRELEEVVARTERVMRTENLVRKAILRGVDPQAAYLEFGKF